MKDYTKKYKREMEFFIHPKTEYVTYNEKCLSCPGECKQSFRAQIVACPHCEKKEVIVIPAEELKPTRRKKS